MHALIRRRVVLLRVVVLAVLSAPACKARITPAQCDELIARYATLVVKEKIPDAGPAVIEAEQKRERDQAAHEDAFRNCTTEVQREEHRCAMAAKTAEAFEKCLE
jgi:hypothetical protein